jgi:hypothetical protein
VTIEPDCGRAPRRHGEQSPGRNHRPIGENTMHPCRYTAAALLALAAGLAHADTLSLRVSYSDGPHGVAFVPVHAEVGRFGLTPDIPRSGNGDDWRVVAYDAKGRVLHQVAVRNGTRRHVETFDPKTRSVVRSEVVPQPDDVFEVSLPFDADTASVDVLPASSVRNTSAAGAAALAHFDRGTLDGLVGTSRPMREMVGAAVPAATTILSNGSSSSHMDYVFVGDGYTAAEMAKWRADAQSVINGYLADPLFDANRASMNVYRVDVASNQSGVDEPDRGLYVDTAMDGAFYCSNIDRLLCVNTSKVLNIVGSVLQPDQRDVIIVVSNSTRYGGSGGQVATLSMSSQSIEVALHEIGHTAFGLADEYDYGTCSLGSEPAEPDVTRNATRSVKWGDLITAATPVPTPAGTYANGTVGIFQGAQYCPSGKYRPTENSRMRTLGYPWHAVNERVARAVFAQYSATTPTATGTLASGSSARVPGTTPGYVQVGAGTITGQLTGPSNADFDLFLYKWNGSAWVKVASSDGPTSGEAIGYNGAAGYYYFEIKSYSGTGSYTLQYKFPPP